MTTPPQNTQVVQFHYIDNILVAEYLVNVIDKDAVKQAVQERLAFTQHRECIALIDVSNISHSSNEARAYTCSKESLQKLRAMALLVDHTVSYMLVKMFLLFNKPPIPTRLFKNKVSAIRWLKKFH